MGFRGIFGKFSRLARRGAPLQVDDIAGSSRSRTLVQG